jgi:RNA polymerase sigma-70 factor (ECF subfamily)
MNALSPVITDLTRRTLLEDLDQIFRDNYQWVYRTAYGVTGRPEDAEDVLQNLFLRLLQRGFPPDFRRNARGYLYRAAINLALDRVRSRRRQILREKLASMQSVASTMNSGSNEEIEASLLKVVAELEPESAELLVLRYVDNHSDAEIARMRGTSRGTIAVRLFRTRAKIRKLIMRAHDQTALLFRA